MTMNDPPTYGYDDLLWLRWLCLDEGVTRGLDPQVHPRRLPALVEFETILRRLRPNISLPRRPRLKAFAAPQCKTRRTPDAGHGNRAATDSSTRPSPPGQPDMVRFRTRGLRRRRANSLLNSAGKILLKGGVDPVSMRGVRSHAIRGGAVPLNLLIHRTF
jgi:hypothetical protein